MQEMRESDFIDENGVVQYFDHTGELKPQPTVTGSPSSTKFLGTASSAQLNTKPSSTQLSTKPSSAQMSAKASPHLRSTVGASFPGTRRPGFPSLDSSAS